MTRLKNAVDNVMRLVLNFWANLKLTVLIEVVLIKKKRVLSLLIPKNVFHFSKRCPNDRFEIFLTTLCVIETLIM